MQFVTGWSTPDRRSLVNFDNKVLGVFREHIQRLDIDAEAGGLLLGEVRGTHLNLIRATFPTVDDLRSRYSFERLPQGHAEVAQKMWSDSRGTVRYLGEWHTHPQDFPTPSGIDRSEWKRLASGRKDKRPFLAVIVGRAGLHVELVPLTGSGIVLSPCD
ncbi:Mov34/MPN/PAD-1 family protein [Delftia sp. S67]|nr:MULTISPECIES: Mov34/MPN/PAD-1 family protein [unclassified Delftia]MBK0114033.1 Mov34/MPN/PAD-1 family protein [Delftia sp. S65]MBK0117841.1 Mov34/MPN/PAD-1 family protein [Delftia sp. S67]MBK0129160.1 Mov34/MPN/PAD-1 family protein [Delftia sp. S66]